jgi:hypothetical protein
MVIVVIVIEVLWMMVLPLMPVTRLYAGPHFHIEVLVLFPGLLDLILCLGHFL